LPRPGSLEDPNMTTPSHDVAVWQSGRLAGRGGSRSFHFGRTQWVGASLLVASAVVFAAFVSVLESDVQRNEIAHAEQHARAQAVVACQAAHPTGGGGSCLALLKDGAVSAQPTPPNEVYELRSGERVPTPESETSAP
jgi:hypothetical protein